MTLPALLERYLKEFGCTMREVADASGLSMSVVSRYRSGARTPDAESGHLRKLAAGVCAASAAHGGNLAQADVLAELRRAVSVKTADAGIMTDNLNALISVLGIKLAQMARSMNYDASYLSRIRAGQRRPADRDAFAGAVCHFVVRHYGDEESRASVAGLMGTTPEAVADDFAYLEMLKEWLCSGASKSLDSYISGFLHKMDDFDVNEYIRAIHFDEIKVPSVPFQLPTTKTYYGVEELKQGELDFFKATALSKSKYPVTMCSDMPMTDMAADGVFPKKWMFGLAVILRKGLHLNMIHDLDRPFDEMMLGLENWIPLYMTGQISPYYLKEVQNSVYCHAHYVSGAAALDGECISGFHDKGKYILTKNREDLEWYKTYAECLLKKAYPLMQIYRDDAEKSFYAFLRANETESGTRHSILSSLPLYTMPRAVLAQMTEALPGDERRRITEYAAEQKRMAEAVLAHGTMLDEVPDLSEAEFGQYPMKLSLSGLFYKRNLIYTYDQYRAHLESTLAFSGEHGNYSVRTIQKPVFRNIQIRMHEGRWAMVSKIKSPVVHFVIRHPKLRGAMENMIVPVMERTDEITDEPAR